MLLKLILIRQKKKALNVALNKISGEWDIDKLGLLLNELKTDNFDLDITGFDADELDGILFNVDELDDTFDLKDGDRTPIQTMSLTFSDDQAEIINEAIDKMKQKDTYKKL